VLCFNLHHADDLVAEYANFTGMTIDEKSQIQALDRTQPGLRPHAARSYIDRANSFALVGHAVKSSIAVSRAKKDRGMEKKAETGVLSIEARAMCAIGGSSPSSRYPRMTEQRCGVVQTMCPRNQRSPSWSRRYPRIWSPQKPVALVSAA
jgi:hypothetical protein